MLVLQAMFDAFTARLRELGFRVGIIPVQVRVAGQRFCHCTVYLPPHQGMGHFRDIVAGRRMKAGGPRPALSLKLGFHTCFSKHDEASLLLSQPKMDDGGILGRERDYEGGFVMMAVEHEGAPAASWHRDDLFI